jgi:aflatoxin B1 aldehyde reductase
LNQFLDAFIARGYNHLDTARVYPASEERLGKVSAATRLTIDTKVMPGMMSADDSNPQRVHTKAQVLADIDESLKTLKTTQINVEYLHAPDRNTPFSEACEAMDEAHKAGKIRAWGLSNYKAQEVQSIVDICDERGLLRPTVYQGQYNPLVRGGEKELFPVLRRAGMAFYAYSPAAGGFFAGNYQNPRAGGRFDLKVRIGNLSRAGDSFWLTSII